jgi:hypothetical protein
MRKTKPLTFPRLSQQEMARFLGIKAIRLSWATTEGIVERDNDGLYHPAVVTPAWLAYVVSPRARNVNRGNEFERERARLTRAKAAMAELRLAVLDHALVGTDDIIERVKTVSLRIRNKMLMSLPRMARACYSAPNVKEATQAARREFDLLIAELSALQQDGIREEFEVVSDDVDGESAEGPAADKGPGRRAGRI